MVLGRQYCAGCASGYSVNVDYGGVAASPLFKLTRQFIFFVVSALDDEYEFVVPLRPHILDDQAYHWDVFDADQWFGKIKSGIGETASRSGHGYNNIQKNEVLIG